MAKSDIAYRAYRINVVHQEDGGLFKQVKYEGDQTLLKVLQAACEPKFDTENQAGQSEYRWSARFLDSIDSPTHGFIYSFLFARSLLSSYGEIVTDTGVQDDRSMVDPPPAIFSSVFVSFKRHIILIEDSPFVQQSNRWLKIFHKTLDKVTNDLQIPINVRIEPIPERYNLINLFNRFGRVTRLRVRLRLPNPEVNRLAKSLYDELIENGIEEYLQDMRSSEGLNKEDDGRARKTLEVAQAGYKKGDVRITGQINGKSHTETKGRDAARIQLDDVGDLLRSFVRGQMSTAKTKEGKILTEGILAELNKVLPPPENDDER